MNKRIKITPHKTLYKKIGASGHSLSEALAELVDNSIDARKEELEINIMIDPEKIEITDTGEGMNEEEAKKSVTIAYSNKKDGKLGKFGLGMKAACMSIGDAFMLETKKSGNDVIQIDFDKEEFENGEDWSVPCKVEKSTEDILGKSYTKITISKIPQRIDSTKIIDDISKKLGERFSSFIDSDGISIYVNGQKLRSYKQEILEDTKKEFEIKLSNGSKIKGWTALLKVGSSSKSGFNLYRYGRLISVNQKLGYIYHPSKMSVTGEVHLNSLEVTHTKREFNTESPLYKEFYEKFLPIVDDIVQKASKKHKNDKVNQLPKHLKNTVDQAILYALNNTDSLQDIAFGNQAERRDENGDFKNKEKRNVAEEKSITINDNVGNKKRTPKKTQNIKERYITIAGKKYQYEYRWDVLREDVAKEGFLDKENNKFIVTLNSAYTMLNVVKLDIFYLALYVTEGIIEALVQESGEGPERITPLRDSMLSIISKFLSDSKIKKIVSN